VTGLFSLAITSALVLSGTARNGWWSRPAWSSDADGRGVTAFCGALHTIQSASDGLIDLLAASQKIEDLTTDKDDTLIRVILGVAPAGIGVLLVVLSIVFITKLVRELQFVTELINDTPDEIKERALAPIRINGTQVANASHVVSQSKYGAPVIALSMVIVVCGVGEALLAMTIALEARSCSGDLRTLGGDVFAGMTFAPTVEEIVFRVLVARLLAGGEGVSVDGSPFSAPNMTGLTNMTAALEKLETLLEAGRDDMFALGSLAAVAPEAEEILVIERCERVVGVISQHELYRCNGYLELGNILIELAEEAKAHVSEFDGEVRGDAMTHMLHVLIAHFLPMAAELEGAIAEDLPGVAINQFASEQVRIFVGMLALGAGLGLSMLILRLICDWTFTGMKVALRRLPPEMVTQHPLLLNYLLGIKTDTRSSNTTMSVMNMASDGIFVLNTGLLIDSVNSGVQAILGFSAEALLGQKMQLVLNRDSGTRFAQTAGMMQRLECPRIFTDNFTCLRDDDTQIPAQITLIGMLGRRSKDITAFVVELKDMRMLQEQQAEAEREKKRSEELLYAILPRDIVARINQGERDIALVVRSATLCFVDIEKFSDYAALLTPQETMRSLAVIFDGYDSAITKYPLCMKMKFVGDVYIMASGIFSPEVDPVRHAEETVRFSLDCLAVIEEANRQLDATLGVRIGVNTGGPLTAGVLGSDKPLFDILGDPINIAARLQSTDPCGKVQISEDTFSLVKDLDFNIAPRGMVFLKGKGERPAYLVSRSIRTLAGEAARGQAGGRSLEALLASGASMPTPA
jgi:class 3 adenylate cyclase